MSEQFGSILKTAREEKNISLAQVSEALKLSIEKINAIENSEVSELPPAAFTCGYLRLFSKQVGVNEDEIIRLYYQQVGGGEEIATPNPTSDIPSQASSNHPGMRLASIAIAALIVMLTLIWWSDRSETSDVVSDEIITESSEAENNQMPASTDEIVSTGQENTKALTIETETLIQEESSVSQPADEFVAKIESDTVTESKQSIDAELPVSDSNDVEEVSQSDEQARADDIIKRARMASPVAEVGVDAIYLKAKDDCWVEITDANDHLLFFSLLKKGEDAHLSGQQPFKVFLGKASAVDIQINNLDFDVSRYERSNKVARFTMSMDKAKEMQRQRDDEEG